MATDYYFDSAAISETTGQICIRLSETTDAATNTSRLTITNVWFKHNGIYGGNIYALPYFDIYIGNQLLMSLTESNQVGYGTANAWVEFPITQATSSAISHNSDGTGSTTLSIVKQGDSYTHAIVLLAPSSGWDHQTCSFDSGSQKTVTLTQIPRNYTLSISAGTGSSITVRRGSTTLSNGATITYGDVLTISFAASTGYNLGTQTVTVAGTAYTGGGTYTVTGNVSVVSTATLKTFTLSISAGTGSSITVRRGSTTLSNGATITYGDVLTISFAASTGYNLGTQTVTVAGTAYTGGGTYTVTGNVSVVSTASRQTFTLSINAGSNSNIVVKRSGATLSDGATITYGDTLVISFSARSGYNLGTQTVTVAGTAYTGGGTYTVTGNVSVVSTATKAVYTLHIYTDEHSTVTVMRDEVPLEDGATLSYNDRLHITAQAATGYTLSKQTVNDMPFNGSIIIDVTGDTSITVYSTANPYTLTINEGINTSVEVLRGSEVLLSGAVIAYGDVLTISFGVSTGYALGTHTVNGVTFASGNTYTVTEDVVVTAAAVTSGQLTEPTNITPDEVYGTGSVDIEDGLTVSWQVNGNVAMTAYSITIYENTAASPQLYTTGQISLSAPFWGHDYRGDLQRFTASTIPAAALTGAGLTNGNEYKFVITQWWGAANSITQAVPSVFATRSTPQLTVAYSRNDGTTYYFTGEYTQAQGVPLNWVRWTITEGSVNGDAVYDTGVISGTGELQVAFSGMIPGRTYYIHCQIETIDGVRIEASTSYIVQYDQSYVFSGNVTVCQQGEAGVKVIWELQDFAENYAIHRRRKGDSFSQKIADVNGFTTWVLDVSAASRSEYVYYVFPIGADGTIFAPGISQSITPDYWTWALIEAQEIGESLYSVQNVYRFRMGKGGVSQGGISNNNSPSLLQNFTRYPLRQPSSANYRNGSLSALIGTISSGLIYSDSVQQMESILALSNTQNALFLSDPKGHFLRVESSGPITYSVDIRSEIMPQTVTFPWVETDSTQMVTVLALSENVIGMEEISSGKLMTDGSITAAGEVTRDVTSDPIAVAGDYLILTVNVPGLEDGQSVRGAVVFYDANGAVISGDENYGDDGNGSYEHVFQVPAGAVTVRVGWSPYQGASVTVSFADAADSFEEDDLSFSVSTGDLVETRQAGYLPNLVFELINGRLTATGGGELQLWQEGGHLFSLDNN